MDAEQLKDVMLVAAGALVVLAGVYLAGRNLYWRKHAAQVTGTVIGVKYRDMVASNGRKGFQCYAVYRYTLPSGGEAEGMDYGGDIGLAKKETGRQEQLMVFEDDPAHVVVRRGAWGWLLPLLIMGLPGLGVVAFNIATPPDSEAEFYPLIFAAMAAGLMLSRLWIPQSRFWRTSLWASRPEGFDDVPIVPIEQIKT